MSKLAPNHCRKTMIGWEPVSAEAREFHAKTKLGQVVELKGRRPRNPGHHKKLFALLGLVVANTDDFANVDDALIGLKATLGMGRWAKPGGASREIFYPDSIAFDAMSQDEFEPFYENAVAAVRRWWLPVDDHDLREAVEAFAA